MKEMNLLEDIKAFMARRAGSAKGTHHLDSIKFSISSLQRKRNDQASKGDPGSDTYPELEGLFFTTGQGVKDLPEGARLGVSLGCSLAGMVVNIGIEDPIELTDLIKAQSPKTMFRIGPNRTWLEPSQMRSADLIELDIVDRTERDLDGMARKMLEIDQGKDLINLVHMIDLLLQKPVFLNINSLDLESDIDHYLVTKAQGIVVRCDPGLSDRSSGLDPVVSTVIASEHMGVFHSKDKGVKLQMNGPIRNGSDVVKLLALGADGIGLDHFVHEFLLSYLSVRNGPKDLDILDVSSYPEDLDWAEIGELFSSLLEDLKEDVRETLSLLNIPNLKELNRSILSTDSYDTASVSGLKLCGFGAPLPFWRHRS
jgi:hypothetical protein